MKEGDFVIYVSNEELKIGKYVRTQFNKRLVIMPRVGERAIRNRSKVLSLNDLFKKYGDLLKGESR
jgi:hypothetical protein